MTRTSAVAFARPGAWPEGTTEKEVGLTAPRLVVDPATGYMTLTASSALGNLEMVLHPDLNEVNPMVLHILRQWDHVHAALARPAIEHVAAPPRPPGAG